MGAYDVQVRFRFPRSTEIRFLEAAPSAGDQVIASNGRAWTVAEVTKTGWQVYDAICVPPEDPRRGPRDHLTHLLGRARSAVGRSRSEKG